MHAFFHRKPTWARISQLMQVDPLKWKAGEPLGPKSGDAAAEPSASFKRSPALSCNSGCRREGDLEIKLQPMEIRTFLLTVA